MDLNPKESSFELKAIDKELRLNPVTLRDEAWLSENYSPEEIYQIFTDVNMLEISRIVFRLLNNDDKMFFKSREVTFITENGDELTEVIGGVTLLRELISGPQEKLAILNALNDTFGVSRPVADKPEPSKKKVVKKRTTKKK